MRAFRTLALDVPRRFRSGWIVWILLVLGLLALAFGAGSIGVGGEGEARFATLFGKEMGAPPGGRTPPLELLLRDYVGGLFAVFLACYVGAFSGLIFLADAVPSAFQPGAAELVVPKPLPRAAIVLARHVGALVVAGAFALLIVGGAFAIVRVRTGIALWSVLWGIPCSLAVFGLLHAVGSLAGALSRNAFLGAFASLAVWTASIVTAKVSGALVGGPPGVFKTIGEVCRVAHRILPRAYDLQVLAERLIENELGSVQAGGTSGEVELVLQCVAWWGVALGVTILAVRKRDL